MKRKILCVFCEQPRLNNERIFASDSVKNNPNFLCESCVKKCHSASLKHPNTQKESGTNAIKPSVMFAKMKEYVIGQDEPIKLLSTIFYNHYKQSQLQNRSTDQKFHTILIGPSGCGKTMMITKMAELYDVCFITVDATQLTAAGYAGDDVEQFVHKLYEISGGDIAKCESAVVFIDEIDKCKKHINNGRDVRGEEVQFGLLKILDGKSVSVPLKKTPLSNETVNIRTGGMLFLFSGFFNGVANNSTHTSILKNVIKLNYSQVKITPDTLIEYGMTTEMVGRINNIITCNELEKEDLFRILKNEKTSVISQYKNLLKSDGIELEFDDEAIMTIATLANRACGARDLASLVSLVLRDILFSAPDNKENNIHQILIDKHYVLKTLNQIDNLETINKDF